MDSFRFLPVMSLCAGLALSTASLGITYTVGGDPACDFTSLQAAINAAQNDGDPEAEIRIARSQTYTAIAVNISDHSMDLIGGYDDCLDTAPSSRTTLSGAGGTADTVIDLLGTANRRIVRLQHLGISNGDPGAGKFGGGLSILGHMDVFMEDVVFSSNVSDRGGAIFIDGTQGAEFTIDAASQLFMNTANQSGGAIHCVAVDDPMQRIFVAADLFGNAAFNGGAVYADACRYSHRGEEGGDGIFFNSATNDGGGLYATNGSVVDLTGDNGLMALSVNIADRDGGGLFVDGNSVVDLRHVAMNGNFADRAGGGLRFNSGEIFFGTTGRCGLDRCSRIEDNGAGTGAGSGGAISQTGGELTLFRTWITGNTANSGSAIRSSGGTLELKNSVVANNRNGSSVIRLTSGTYSIVGTTIADNEDMSSTVIYDNVTLDVRGVIIWESMGNAMATGAIFPSTLTVECYLAHNAAAFPFGATVAIQDDPLFVDTAAGNYRLQRSSPAVDVCTPFATLLPKGLILVLDPDIDGYERGVDLQDVPDVLGPFDLGASEYLEVIFVDGFESTGPLMR